MRFVSRGIALWLSVAFALFAAGCGQGENRQQTQTDSKKSQRSDGDAQTRKDQGEEKSKHEGWWCDEHGIPEAECSMCSKKVADDFKAKGDWCAKHNRAHSQCFKCDPSLKEKFAARYRARYGKEPPPITEDE